MAINDPERCLARGNQFLSSIQHGIESVSAVATQETTFADLSKRKDELQLATNNAFANAAQQVNSPFDVTAIMNALPESIGEELTELEVIKMLFRGTREAQESRIWGYGGYHMSVHVNREGLRIGRYLRGLLIPPITPQSEPILKKPVTPGAELSGAVFFAATAPKAGGRVLLQRRTHVVGLEGLVDSQTGEATATVNVYAPTQRHKRPL